MILYNITINVDSKVTAEWLNWMKEAHIPEIMDTGHFESNKVFKLLNEDPEGNTYACQYFAQSIDEVISFQEQHAAALQAKMYQKFGNSTADFRTLLQEVLD